MKRQSCIFTISLIAFGLIIVAMQSSSQETNSSLVRHTAYGDVEGMAVESSFGDQVIKTYAWLGVPYAKPPVGDLRWRAPRTPEKWEGVRESKQFCAPCAQQGGMMSTFNCSEIGKFIGSESCLCVNIWRPQNDKTNLPVFFWIYGGANMVGQSSMTLYDGSNFAGKQDFIFVSLNYRLGPMGWFAHPALREGDALDDSGNYGTLDIIQALKWVNENIASFGGDPKNVTIAGESAGGVNVYSMLVSPLAAGLFQRAISQSGAPMMVDRQKGDEIAQSVLEQLVIKDKLADSRESAKRFIAGKDRNWVASFLRSKRPEEIYACYEQGTMGSLKGSKQVFVDGNVIVTDPIKTFKSGKYNRVPFLVGSNRQEAKLFLPLMIGKLKEPELCQMIKDMDPEHPNVNIKDYASVIDRMIYNPLACVSGVGFKKVGVDKPAKIMSQHQKEIYRYRFDWDEEPKPMDFLIGSGHAMEIPFIFGNFQTDLDSALRFAWTQENRARRLKLSEEMMSYWANFARSGNPNGAGLPVWNPYPSRMILDAH